MSVPTPSTGSVVSARPDVFLSYAREDKAFADRLSAALLERGKDVWIDIDDIRAGASDWRASVWAGIEASKVIVPVLSPDLLASVVCGEELERAIALNKRLVPVLRRPVEGLAVAPAVEAPNWIYAREEDDFEDSVVRLVEAVELDEAWVEQHVRYTQRTTEWLRSDRDPSYLLRGSDLSTAERWLDDEAGHDERATADQVTYITAGRRAAARRQRSLLGGAGLALVVTMALAIVALVLRATAVDNERTARARAAAAQAIAALSRDPEESVRRALEAVDIRVDEPEAGFALRRAVAEAGWSALLRRGGTPAPLLDADIAPDGRRVATASDDGTAAIWDPRTGRSVVLAGHAGAVTAIAFSPDGRQVATSSADGTARTWDASSGDLVHVLDTGSRHVSLVTWGAGGRLLATAGDRGARVWAAASGREVARLPADGDVARTIRLSPDGSRVVTPGAAGRDAWLWDVATRRRVATLRGSPGDALRLARFSADGRRIMTVDTAGDVVIRATAGGRRIARFAPRRPQLTDADLSRDGRRVVTAGADGIAEVWDVGRQRRIALLRNGESLASAQLDRRGGVVVTGGDDGVARVWDVAAERAVQELRGHTAAIAVARFTPDGAEVVTASDDGSARVWPARPRTPADRSWQRADSTSFAPDSRHVLVVQGARRGVWDVATGHVVELHGGIAVTDAPAWPCGRAAGCAPWSPDGRRVAGATAGGRAAIWDARSGAVRRRIGTATGTVIGAAFTADGRRVVVVDGDQPRAEVVTLAAGRPAGRVPARAADPLQSAEFAGARGRVLTVDAAGVARLSDPARKTSIRLTGTTRPAAATRPPAVAASGDGPQVAVGTSDGPQVAVGTSDGVLRVFADPARPPSMRRATFGAPVTSVAISRDGTLVATGGQKGTTRIWDARTLEPATLQAPGGEISGVTFSPGGGLVLVTSGPFTRLWDRVLRRSVLDLPRTADARAELSPDGRWILLAGAGRLEVRRCDACAPLDELVRRARSLLPPAR